MVFIDRLSGERGDYEEFGDLNVTEQRVRRILDRVMLAAANTREISGYRFGDLMA